MSNEKKMQLTRLQGIIAIASFSAGVLIACVWGQIDTSAVSIVSELLILCGAILGVKASYDVKFRKFQAELDQVLENENKTTTLT